MPAVPDNAHLFATELHFTLESDRAAFVVVNLQDYPNWHVTRNGSLIPTHLARPDGLLTLAIPPGESVIDITWHHTWDEILGAVITAFALLLGYIHRLVRLKQYRCRTPMEQPR
jgi:hypothetical protein